MRNSCNKLGYIIWEAHMSLHFIANWIWIAAAGLCLNFPSPKPWSLRCGDCHWFVLSVHNIKWIFRSVSKVRVRKKRSNALSKKRKIDRKREREICCHKWIGKNEYERRYDGIRKNKLWQKRELILCSFSRFTINAHLSLIHSNVLLIFVVHVVLSSFLESFW